MSKVLMKRHSNVWVIVGSRQTGKTTMLLKQLQGKRVLFVSYSPMDEKMRDMEVVKTEYLKYLKPGPGVWRVDISPYLRPDGKTRNDIYRILEDIRTHFFDGHVVFDDIMPVIGYNPNSEFMTAIISCRHNCNDIYFIYHNPNDVAPFIYKQCGYMILFKTGDVDIRKSIDKMNRSGEVMKMWEHTRQRSFPAHDFCFLCTDPVDDRSYEPFVHIHNTAA